MVKNKLAIYLLLFFNAISFIVNAQQSRTPKQYTSKQLRENIAVVAAGFNTNETKVLVHNNKTGIFNVYLLDIADTISQPLTNSSTNSYFANDFVPGTNRFIYTHDEGGNENKHIYIMNGADMETKDLTPWPKSKNSFLGWSADKKAMYVNSNKRNPKFFDIWKLDTLTWTPTLLYQNDSGMNSSVISKSERYVALTKSISSDKNQMFLYDLLSNSIKRISNENEASWSPSVIEKNDSIFYYTTNDSSEFTYLVKYNINTSKAEKFYTDKWDVKGMSLSENEKYHIIFVNDDGKNKILVYKHTTNQLVSFPLIKDGDVQNLIISPSEKNMIITKGSSTSPANIYTYNTDTKVLRKLTSTLNKEVDEKDLVKADIIRFKSFDGKEISAIYYKPLQASKSNKVAALVWVHGGLGGQSRIGFSNSIQYLVNHGYAVLAINYRGSSGYGKTFYKLKNKQHGYGDLKDCIWAKKWLASQAYIDSSAIGIYGGSYGGNMVLNALCLHPDEFKVGIDLYGVSNWLRTLRSIPPYWESMKKALYDEMGDPNTKDSILLKATSPLYNYQKIKKPLIVFQGANDVRVLKIESDEIVAGVKKNGVPIEYIVYPQEGHGFIKTENLITTDEKSLAFLKKYLKIK